MTQASEPNPFEEPNHSEVEPAPIFPDSPEATFKELFGSLTYDPSPTNFKHASEFYQRCVNASLESADAFRFALAAKIEASFQRSSRHLIKDYEPLPFWYTVKTPPLSVPYTSLEKLAAFITRKELPAQHEIVKESEVIEGIFEHPSLNSVTFPSYWSSLVARNVELPESSSGISPTSEFDEAILEDGSWTSEQVELWRDLFENKKAYASRPSATNGDGWPSNSEQWKIAEENEQLHQAINVIHEQLGLVYLPIRIGNGDSVSILAHKDAHDSYSSNSAEL